MIPEKTVELHRRAAMAIDSFTPKERERVEKSLGRLATHRDGLHFVGARKISSGEPLYVMRASPGIRAIFRKTPGGIVVEDVVRRETLNSFMAKDSVTGRILPSKRQSKTKSLRPEFLKTARLKRNGGP